MAVVVAAAALALLPRSVAGEQDSAPPRPPAVQANSADWLPSLAEGRARAQKLRQPIFVRAGGPGCPWCRKLEQELESPALKEELARWTLVAIDVDAAEKDAEALAVGPIPALRLLTPAGRVVASADGYRPAAALATWLREHYTAASGVAAEELTAEEAPTVTAVPKLVAALGQRDPTPREAAARRLLPHPALAARPVAEAFAAGPLQARLASLDLLREWGAPVAGLDSWRPETVTPDALKALREWAANPPGATPVSAELTPERLAAARADLDRLVQVPDAEAVAVRERLARHGAALLGEVYVRLRNPPSDLARERLTALRYRLVARDAVALGWPGGLDRLASADPAVRRQAVRELVEMATAADEALLLELFSSPDALVRELSLRALSANAGRQAAGALTRLLDDPEANVRAAVLKQLAEKPAPGMVPKVAAFAVAEVDADLVVHAVRVLREAGGRAAVECLVKLLKHSSWRVRAEAAQALGEAASRSGGRSGSGQEDTSEPAWAALIEALQDADGFVVSRAVGALVKADRADAVEPLAAAVDAHPELAAEVVKALNAGQNTRLLAKPHLLKFRTHARPAVRAAAIRQLVWVADDAIGDVLRDGLKDPSSDVRTAAADAAFAVVGRIGHESDQADRPGAAEPEPGILGGLRRLFGSQPAAMPDDPDAWLTRLRAGKTWPAWAAQVADLLPPLLTAEAADERTAGALALVALGQADAALPVLTDAAKKAPAQRGKAVTALSWLPWAKRTELYRELLTLEPDPEQLADIVQGLVHRGDRRALPLLWDLAARDGLTAEQAAGVYEGLTIVLFGNVDHRHYPGSRGGPRPDVAAVTSAARPRAEAGPELQRLLALMLLAKAAPAAAGDLAAKLVAAPETPPALRRDAFQVWLLGKPRSELPAAAIEALTHADAGARRAAVAVLAGRDASWLGEFRDGHLSLGGDSIMVTDAGINENRPFVPAPPDGLTADAVRPFLADADPSTAAAAGYLLTLFGDAAGFDLLVRYWRTRAPHDDFWTRLVCRAVTALGDDVRVAILEEAYRGLGDTHLTVREFYWTIRALEGPNALRLRKLIRDEVGMNNLRVGGVP